MTGLAGEYLVAGMMNLKGWVASLTLKNYPCVDIFGKNPSTGENASIQVKSCRGTNFFIGYKRSERSKMQERVEGPFVFVYINKQEEVSYFILTKEEFIRLVNETDDAYFNGPHKKTIKPDYSIAVSLKHLLPYKDKWDSLWK